MGLKQDRESKDILKNLSLLLLTETKDKHLRSVTLTEVILTSDLKQAKVYYSVHTNKEEVAKSLERASGYLRTALTSHLSVKHSPELIFIYDESIENASKIEGLLEGLKE